MLVTVLLDNAQRVKPRRSRSAGPNDLRLPTVVLAFLSLRHRALTRLLGPVARQTRCAQLMWRRSQRPVKSRSRAARMSPVSGQTAVLKVHDRWLPLAGFQRGGFCKVDSLDSTKESSTPRSRFRKYLIKSRFSPDPAPSGFRLASPVKMPVASETPRCAPPHTLRAGEEPCQGGAGRGSIVAETLIPHARKGVECVP